MRTATETRLRVADAESVEAFLPCPPFPCAEEDSQHASNGIHQDDGANKQHPTILFWAWMRSIPIAPEKAITEETATTIPIAQCG